MSNLSGPTNRRAIAVNVKPPRPVLGKNEPPKGDKESWEKLTKSYLDTAKQLDKAAQAKEKSKAVVAHTKLTKMCMACHKAHKGK